MCRNHEQGAGRRAGPVAKDVAHPIHANVLQARGDELPPEQLGSRRFG